MRTVHFNRREFFQGNVTKICGAIVLTLVLHTSIGCKPLSAPPMADNSPAAVMPEAVRENLLAGAMEVLDHLDSYEESAAFTQVFDRLNQWSHSGALRASSADGWQCDPLLSTLSERLKPMAKEEILSSSVFDAVDDIKTIRDQRWLADIAASARGDALDEIEIAANLFQWTIRSLAITSDPPMVPSAATPGARWFLPGEILLSGRASGAQRAWIFLQLLRHAGLDGVMLATGTAAGNNPRPWIPALISDGEAYLFEPTYGLPISGPGGKGIATARQAAADRSILESLSFPDRPYPIGAADIASLLILIDAEPWSLSRRMHALDANLAGSKAIDLYVDATALGKRAAQSLPSTVGPEVGPERIGLWEFPWEVLLQRRENAANVNGAIRQELAVMTVALAQPAAQGGRMEARVIRPLYAARLRDFRGNLAGPEGAKISYLAARPSNAAVREALKQMPPQQAEAIKRLYEQMKEDATYWLGVATLLEGDYETSVDYLDRMTLGSSASGAWTDAARINLAQACMAMGRTEQAIKLLREDPSPQRFGSRIVANRLEKAPP